MPRRDIEALRLYRKQYYAANRAKALVDAKAYRDAHKEERDAYQREYYKRNRLRSNAWAKQRYHKNKAAIRERMRPYERARYAKNKVRLRALGREWYAANRERLSIEHRARADEFLAFKCSIGCRECGYNKHGAALEFHHLDPKLKLRHIKTHNWKTDTGKAEIAKCILLCANCHHIETINQKRGRNET